MMKSVIRPVRETFARRRKLRGALNGLSRTSDALNPVKYALQRCLRGSSLQERKEWAAIERQWDALMQSGETIDICGSRTGLSQHAANSSSRRPETDFMFQLTRVLQPDAALELGTNVGMSACYIAAALKLNGKGHLWTIDGVPDLAKVAQNNFKATGLDKWATSVTGWFKDSLAPTLEHGPFRLAYIDGHHDGDATLDYFRQIKPHLGPNSIVLFSDINWSRGMQRAWQAISEDKDLRDAGEVLGEYGAVAIW